MPAARSKFSIGFSILGLPRPLVEYPARNQTSNNSYSPKPPTTTTGGCGGKQSELEPSRLRKMEHIHLWKNATVNPIQYLVRFPNFSGNDNESHAFSRKLPFKMQPKYSHACFFTEQETRAIAYQRSQPSKTNLHSLHFAHCSQTPRNKC